MPQPVKRLVDDDGLYSFLVTAPGLYDSSKVNLNRELETGQADTSESNPETEMWMIMKMLLMSALMWGLGIQAASAAKSPLTPEEFTEAQKKRAEAKGVPFDLDHVEFLFNAMDRDSDGLVTAEEKEAYWVRRESQRKKKTGPVKPVVTATAKPKRPNVTETLDEYMERQKARQTQRGARFNEEKFLKVFREMDADADGSVTPEESKVYWKAKNR